MYNSDIPDTSALADEATHAVLVARATANLHWRMLHAHLVAEGFVPGGEPCAYVAQRRGAIVRSVVTREYRAAESAPPGASPEMIGKTATLSFSLERDETASIQALIIIGTRLDWVLRVTEAGEVEATAPLSSPPAPRPADE